MAATPLSRAALTVSGWWPWWEIELQARGVRPATVTMQRRALRKLVRHLGDVPPADVSAIAVAQWPEHMRDTEHRKPSSINAYALSVLTFLRWLVEQGDRRCDRLQSLQTVVRCQWTPCCQLDQVRYANA